MLPVFPTPAVSVMGKKVGSLKKIKQVNFTALHSAFAVENRSQLLFKELSPRWLQNGADDSFMYPKMIGYKTVESS